MVLFILSVHSTAAALARSVPSLGSLRSPHSVTSLLQCVSCSGPASERWAARTSLRLPARPPYRRPPGRLASLDTLCPTFAYHRDGRDHADATKVIQFVTSPARPGGRLASGRLDLLGVNSTQEDIGFLLTSWVLMSAWFAKVMPQDEAASSGTPPVARLAPKNNCRATVVLWLLLGPAAYQKTSWRPGRLEGDASSFGRSPGSRVAGLACLRTSIYCWPGKTALARRPRA